MNFELNSDQILLRNLVEKFVRNRTDGRKRVRSGSPNCSHLARNWSILAECGILGVPFSSEFGGFNGGLVEVVTVMEQLGRGIAEEPVLEEILLAGGLLSRAGTAAQKSLWLPKIIAGDARMAVAHFEHAARFNLSFVETRAQKKAGETILSGRKTFVPGGDGVSAYLISARETGDASDQEGISFYLVPRSAPGLSRRPYSMIDGSAACELELLAVEAGEKLPGGFREFAQTVDEVRVGACAEMIGIMSTLFEMTLEHVRTRKQFGTALGTFQVIQHRLADLYASLELSRSQLYRAAAIQSGGERKCAVAAAKSYISLNALRMGEEAIQLHGGIGVTDELLIGHGHKRLMLLARLFGDSESELDRFIALTR